MASASHRHGNASISLVSRNGNQYSSQSQKNQRSHADMRQTICLRPSSSSLPPFIDATKMMPNAQALESTKDPRRRPILLRNSMPATTTTDPRPRPYIVSTMTSVPPSFQTKDPKTRPTSPTVSAPVSSNRTQNLQPQSQYTTNIPASSFSSTPNQNRGLKPKLGKLLQNTALKPTPSPIPLTSTSSFISPQANRPLPSSRLEVMEPRPPLSSEALHKLPRISKIKADSSIMMSSGIVSPRASPSTKPLLPPSRSVASSSSSLGPNQSAAPKLGVTVSSSSTLTREPVGTVQRVSPVSKPAVAKTSSLGSTVNPHTIHLAVAKDTERTQEKVDFPPIPISGSVQAPKRIAISLYQATDAQVATPQKLTPPNKITLTSTTFKPITPTPISRSRIIPTSTSGIISPISPTSVHDPPVFSVPALSASIPRILQEGTLCCPSSSSQAVSLPITPPPTPTPPLVSLPSVSSPTQQSTSTPSLISNFDKPAVEPAGPVPIEVLNHSSGTESNDHIHVDTAQDKPQWSTVLSEIEGPRLSPGEPMDTTSDSNMPEPTLLPPPTLPPTSVLKSTLKQRPKPTKRLITNQRPSASPLRPARVISGQVKKQSPLALTVTGADGKTRAVGAPLGSASLRRVPGPKALYVDSYKSCGCSSYAGGKECLTCRILKSADAFCMRVDRKCTEMQLFS